MCSLRYRKNRNLLNCDQVLFNVQFITLSLVFLPFWSKNLSLDFQVGVGEELIFG